MADTCDIVIAGGGPVGSALALGLRAGRQRVVLLERRVAVADDDGRTLALSHGSRLILERLGVWDALAPVTPIERISVSQQRGFGRVELSAAEASVPALGYTINFGVLQRALTVALRSSDIGVMAGSTAQAVSGDADGVTLAVESTSGADQLRARLAVIADGGSHLKIAHVRTHEYQQAALVCDVAGDAPHQSRAFERFTSAGPLALLPTERGWSLVWTASPSRAQELATLPEEEFCMQLHAAFGTGLGRFRLLGVRCVFPLVLKYATRPVAPRTLLIGNAAQTLHPVAGQGLNLGLRDAWELARAVVTRGADDPGASAFVKNYFSQRRFDRTATILFTDSLIRLFSNDIPLLDRMRGAALAALGGFAPAKNFLARRMLFGARG